VVNPTFVIVHDVQPTTTFDSHRELHLLAARPLRECLTEHPTTLMRCSMSEEQLPRATLLGNYI